MPRTIRCPTRPLKSYNRMQMQLASIPVLSQPPLAAMPQLREKPRLGFSSKNPALHQVHEVCNSTTALGLQAALHLERIRSRYTGKERDNESGNDYFPARYYSSAMGRWLSPDWSAKREPVPYAKLDNPQSLNLYAYLKNNPLRTTDPDGHADDPCKGKSDCYVTKDDKKQQMTVTQTSTQTNLSKDASGNQISTTTRTTNSETVSTADANRGQVLGGTQTVTTTVANLSNPSQLASTTTTSRDLNPLQAVNAVGADLSKGLQSFAQPSMMDRLMDHKVGASGVVAGGAAGACALAEPCGAVVGTGALIGAGVYAAGAAIYDFATH